MQEAVPNRLCSFTSKKVGSPKDGKELGGPQASENVFPYKQTLPPIFSLGTRAIWTWCLDDQPDGEQLIKTK